MKKRLFSILTALCLCLTLMPTAALAADDTSIPYTPADVNYVLGKAVENGTVSTERDQQLDMDQDGRFTSWDAKQILDTLPAPEGLTLDHENLEMWTGGQVQLHASISPANAYDQEIIWDTSDPSVATVDKNGLVTAEAGGDAAITAACAVNPAIKTECKITVTDSEDLPEISVKALRIKGGSADWVDLTTYHSTLKTTVLNEFYDTLDGMYTDKASGISLEAGTLCGGKLMLQVDYTFTGENDRVLTDSDLVQVDPDSFAAPEMNVVEGTGNWQDATALSDGRLLSASSGDRTVFSLWEDGKWVATGNLEQSALGGSVLVGIASAGANSDGTEALYGLTKDGALYSIPVTIDMSASDPLTLGEAKLIHSNVIPDWYTTDSNDPTIPYTWSMDSVSLLYDNAHGYLLAAATYYSMVLDESQSKVYLIDPMAGTYVPMRVYDEGNDLDEISVFTSLYQYQQKKDAAGVQLYVDKDALTLKAGESMDLPAAEAYTFSTDENGLVTNSKLDADAVEWSSSDKDVTIDTTTGKITAANVAEQKTVTLTAKVTANGETAAQKVTVTVNPNRGMKVGAMIKTSLDDIWAEIDLDATDTATETFTDIFKKGTLDKDYTAAGYAQGTLWGFKSGEIFSIDIDEDFTSSTEPVYTTEDIIVDLTGAPKITTGIPYSGGTMEDPAPLVYVDSSGWIGLLNDKIYANGGEDSLTHDSDYRFSAITYAGDLTAGQVRYSTGEELSNCDASALCHVYYALTKDDTTNGATLRQLILVPQVGTDGTLTYTLCGSTIGTVKEFTSSPYRMSMDFLRKSDGSYGLLVARDERTDNIYYIDLTDHTAGEGTLTATLMGKLTSVTVDNDSKDVNSISGLYHTDGEAMTANEILVTAGWEPIPQSLTGAMLSASPRAASSDQPTISIPITGSTPYGKWTLNYDPDKLAFDSVDAVTDILYKAYSHDEKNHTVTLAYATLGGQDFDADKPVLKVNFTVKEGQSASDADVTKAQGEFNTITVNSSDHGTVAAPDPASALVGSTVKLTAVPDEGYMLHGWKVTPSSVTIKDDNTFTMPGVQVTVEAIFAPLGSHSWEEGWSHDDTNHWHACTGCAEKDSLAAHDFQWIIDKAATTAETGLKHEECTVCHAKRSEGTVINRLSSGGGGGGSSAPTYPVSAPSKAENGSVSISSKNAAKGTTVTITVKPNSGYTLETIIVTDKNGNELKLTDKGNGQYTFTMPDGNVEVKATFMEDNSVLNFFYDVPNDAYYYEAVKWAAEKGVTGGVGNDLFAPNRPCTRAQIVTFLWRAAGSPVVNYAMNMADVAEDAYYAEAVRWALSQGITTGTGDGKFSPDAACTRAQAVAFLFRSAVANGLEAVTLQDLISGFEDAASVPGYAVPAMNWALSQGIVKGSGAQLLPGGTCTRAQIVTFLWRAFDK